MVNLFLLGLLLILAAAKWGWAIGLIVVITVFLLTPYNPSILGSRQDTKELKNED